MPDPVTAPDRSTQPERGELRLTQLYRRIVLVLNAGFIVSVGLMLVGIIVAIVRGQTVGQTAEPIAEVLPAVARFDAQGMIDLGILVLLVTPIAYVLVSLVTFLRQRDALFVSVCLLLLSIIAGSIGLTLT
ncbi:MAG TPA: DUF1634 domain-containing protein [Thermomicrobiales bacterium]|nr:DUF1634 domain-containing protein [Thermomicrobiales bacterium]